MKWLKYLTLFGDSLYIFWVLYNGIDEGFKNIGSVQSVAIMGLILLLGLNIFILRKI